MPRELTIDFGDENCLCRDSKKRRGKIIVTFTGKYRKPGTVITYGFDNYHVNDNHVDGTKIIRNMGLNENNKLHYNIEVVGVIYKADNGGTLSWNSSRVREWIHGAFTFPYWDDGDLATDIAQDTFMKIWEKQIHLHENKNIKALLFKIAGDLFISTHRRQKVIANFQLNLKTTAEWQSPEDMLQFKELRDKV